MTHPLIPFQEKQHDILKFIGNSKMFQLFNNLFLVLHYMLKRPNINLIALIGVYLSGDIYWILSIGCFSAIVLFCIGNLKSRLKVPRPFWVYDDLPLKKKKMERTYSFPSGHTMIIATSLLNVMLFNNFQSWIVFILMSIIMPLSRLYLCVHWISDVLFSVLLSLGLSITWYFIDPVNLIVHDEVSALLMAFIINLLVIASFVYYGLTKFTLENEELKPHTLISYSLSCIERAEIILGIFINWKLGYYDYPATYSEFNHIFISIPIYLATLKIMDMAIEMFKESIDKRPLVLYIFRFLFYLVAILLSLIVPNTI